MANSAACVGISPHVAPNVGIEDVGLQTTLGFKLAVRNLVCGLFGLHPYPKTLKP